MLVFTDNLFQSHETGQHPENPGRLAAIDKLLLHSGALEECQIGEIAPASRESVTAIHTEALLTRIETLAGTGGGQLDAETRVSPRSYQVALHAAGVACRAVEEVCSGRSRRALCLSRPPGHHALPDRAMGFCLLNNVAIAARHAQRVCGVERVLIVDWDVHHGNGTQDVFYSDSTVGFFSIHRFPFYPGTGDWNETGAGAGLGTTWNVPLKFGATRKKFIEQFRLTLDEAVRRMRPQLILLSAGFDAHHLDPIGSLGLETEDFQQLTALVVSAANAECSGRVVSLLEGGYHPDALAECVAVHLDVLKHP